MRPLLAAVVAVLCVSAVAPLPAAQAAGKTTGKPPAASAGTLTATPADLAAARRAPVAKVPATETFARACTAPTAGSASCQALAGQQELTTRSGPAGYHPANLRAAYDLPSKNGKGRTVAVVDAYDDPHAAADLAAYRKKFGLPACGKGCFRKVNQRGKQKNYPTKDNTKKAPNSYGWDYEVALDLDMVSAVCPRCHLLLVEADSSRIADLGAAVNTAVRLGARYVSNSWGGYENGKGGANPYDHFFNHPGVVITASSGDSGYGVSFPASNPHVTAVGGTTLRHTGGSGRGYTETAWGWDGNGEYEATGSGCSDSEPKPGWQHDTGCARRTVADVSMDADPHTGVAVYDKRWIVMGGTSAGAPMVAAGYALAGVPATHAQPASFPYFHTAGLYDITAGNDGTCAVRYLCTAGAGYDGPTGLGSPHGVGALRGVVVANPGTVFTGVGGGVRRQATATDPGRTLTWSATGLPPGTRIDPATGLITGHVPATPASYQVKLVATDGTGASDWTTFSWHVTAQLLANGGFEDGHAAPWRAAAGTVVHKPAHSGHDAARLNHRHRKVAQTITLPAAAAGAKLAFWLRTEAGTGTVKAQLVNANGKVVATLGSYSGKHSTGYRHHTVVRNLAGHAGQRLTLRFVGTGTATFLLDDVAFQVG